MEGLNLISKLSSIENKIFLDSLTEKNLSIKAYHMATEDFPGDMFKWFHIGDGKYAVILIDVMGHEHESSLPIISFASKAIMINSNPDFVIPHLNTFIHNTYNRTELNSYITAFYFLIDTSAKSIEYVNAGHPPAMIEMGSTMHRLYEGCIPLGFYPDISVKKGVISYQDTLSAQLFVYTDGLISALITEVHNGFEELDELLCLQLKSDELFQLLTNKMRQKTTLANDVCFLAIATH